MTNNLLLLLLGMLGVLVHALMKISKLKKTNEFKTADYFGSEWPTMMLNVVIVVIALLIKHEYMPELEKAGIKVGLGIVALGYSGQSIFTMIFDRFEKKLKNLTTE